MLQEFTKVVDVYRKTQWTSTIVIAINIIPIGCVPHANTNMNTNTALKTSLGVCVLHRVNIKV